MWAEPWIFQNLGDLTTPLCIYVMLVVELQYLVIGEKLQQRKSLRSPGIPVQRHRLMIKFALGKHEFSTLCL